MILCVNNRVEGDYLQIVKRVITCTIVIDGTLMQNMKKEKEIALYADLYENISCFVWRYMKNIPTFVPHKQINNVPLPNKYWNFFLFLIFLQNAGDYFFVRIAKLFVFK